MKHKKIRYHNKGDAQFKVMLVSLFIFFCLCAMLYSRLTSDSYQKQKADEAKLKATMESMTNTGGLKTEQNNTSQTKGSGALSEPRDVVEGEVVENKVGASFEAEEPEIPQQEELNQQAGYYYFEMLSDSEKEVYCQILDSIIERQEKTLSTVDADLADKLYQFIIFDHPELFDTNGYQLVKYTRGDKIIKVSIQPKFDMSDAEHEQQQQKIDQYLADFKANLPMGLDTYGKIKYIYEKLIRETDYVLDAPNSQNICSVFVSHKTVCAGYAKATQLLLHELNIPSAIVHGKVDQEWHAWNLVYVNGMPYYLDTTWGDASYSNKSDAEDTSHQMEINYEYFLITERDLKQTHTIEHPEYFPVVTSTTHNYFQKEGLYFTTYDKDKLKGIFDQAYAQGKKEVTIRVSDSVLYSDMTTNLLDEQEAFQYLQGVERMYYHTNDKLRTITIWLQ